MSVVAIIPARMSATRFPGKPMAKILNIPMVGHVYYRTKFSKMVDEIYVATCDQEIFDYVTSIGGKAVMTSHLHKRCTERTSEALLKIEEMEKKKFDIVLMIQGDEPLVTPTMIDTSLKGIMSDPIVQVVNLAAPIKTKEELHDPNTIKVILDRYGDAVYFSRAPIPYDRDGSSIHRFKQVCVIPFRRDFLLEFNSMEETPLEIIESVDMLRILDYGKKVRMIRCDEVSQAVDTLADLRKVEGMMQEDTLYKKYSPGKV
jgi:3-deoxy-manno-octulosonate cytidylyltransferase (CMP-KDO synthetase)